MSRNVLRCFVRRIRWCNIPEISSNLKARYRLISGFFLVEIYGSLTIFVVELPPTLIVLLNRVSDEILVENVDVCTSKSRRDGTLLN